MKKNHSVVMALFFSCFATAGFAQQTKSVEPVLHPIKKETLKVVNEMDKEFQPEKRESKPASSDPTKAKEVDKPKKETPPKEKEKPKKEKPEYRESEKPKYNNKGR